MAAVRVDGKQRSVEILDAALSCFAKQGVTNTGIDDIRKKSKASASSIYHLFGGGIEAIQLALLERTFERLFGHLATEIVKTKTAKTAVMTLVEAHLEWVLENRAEARVMYQSMSLELSPKIAGPLAERKAVQLAPVIAHIAPFQRDGSLPRWSPLELDVAIMGATHEACRRFLAGAPLEEAWLKKHLPTMAWQSLC